MGQLKNLPVNELKIDRSFVMTMTEDSSDALIVHSVVDLGHNLGLTIVAEGVETEQALAALKGFGCDVAQGYHLCRPVPADAFDSWRIGWALSPVPAGVSPGSWGAPGETVPTHGGPGPQDVVRVAPTSRP